MAGINSHGTQVKLGDGGSAGAGQNCTSINGNPTVITAAAHGLTSGSRVTITGMTGGTECNGTWTIDVVNEDMFTIPVNTTVNGAAGTATPLAESFTAIPSCKDITLPSASTDEIDTTTHDSVGKESMDGDTDYGAVTFDINYDPTKSLHQQLQALSMSKATRHWQVVLTDSGNELWAFDGWVNGFPVNAPVSGVYSASVSIKVTGAPSVS